MTPCHLPNTTTLFQKAQMSLIAKNKRLLLVIASRLNGKAKHEKALKNDIWISIFDRKRFKVPKNAKGHYTTQKLMNGNKSAVKFKLSFWLAQNKILTNLKFVDTTRKQAYAFSFHTYNPRRLAKKIFKKIVLSAVIANFVNLRRGGLSVIASRLQKGEISTLLKRNFTLWIYGYFATLSMTRNNKIWREIAKYDRIW